MLVQLPLGSGFVSAQRKGGMIGQDKMKQIDAPGKSYMEDIDVRLQAIPWRTEEDWIREDLALSNYHKLHDVIFFLLSSLLSCWLYSIAIWYCFFNSPFCTCLVKKTMGGNESLGIFSKQIPRSFIHNINVITFITIINRTVGKVSFVIIIITRTSKYYFLLLKKARWNWFVLRSTL